LSPTTAPFSGRYRSVFLITQSLRSMEEVSPLRLLASGRERRNERGTYLQDSFGMDIVV
jgi:hypothetical protein